MTELLLSFLTWTPSLVLSGGLGLVGILGPTFGAFKQWAMLARVIGLLFLCVHCFMWGFRTADDKAEQKAITDALRTQVTSLTSQLANQKLIATIAAGERTRLAEEKAAAASLADAYKAALAEQTAKAPANASCTIDDADLRFRRSLRRPAKAKP